MPEKQNVARYNIGDADNRPWGSWRVVDTGHQFTVKRIEVNPGERLSLQMHNHRSEHWIIVNGEGEITIGKELISLKPDQHIYIPRKTKHRIHNKGLEPLVFVEVQFGQKLDERDIIRLEDDYNRHEQ